MQYAVIQVRRSDAGLERFVIGYEDERTLRQLLARPSIVATGFSSRDEATTKLFTAGIGRTTLLEFISRLRLLCACYELRMLNMRTSPVRALSVMKPVIHIAGAALHKIQSRLIPGRRRLEPAVQ